MGVRYIPRRLAAILAVLSIFSACAKPTESTEVFMPRPVEAGGPDAELRKAMFCTPDRVNFSFLKSEKSFVRTEQFINFFDCANYDYKYEPLSKFIHSPASPQFLESLIDVVKSLSTSDKVKNIKTTMEPLFQEYVDKKGKASGDTNIDHKLKVMSGVIKHISFRKAIPLIAALMDQGVPVWQTLLPRLSRFVYDPTYPGMWQDLRKLFNVRTTSKKIDHLAVTTRDFFQYLRNENDDAQGNRKTNALLLLEILDEVNDLKIPETGLLSVFEYMHNRDIFTTLYQTAAGSIRGEQVMPELNGGGANVKPDPEAIEESKREKVNSLFRGGAKNAALLDLLSVVDSFNQPRPQFLPAISKWFAKESNQKRMHQGMVDFVARRMVGEIINSLQISRYFQAYIGKVLKNKVPLEPAADPSAEAAANPVCEKGLDCVLSGDQFANFFKNAVAHQEFEAWLVKTIDQENKKKFREQNTQLLKKNGALYRELLAIYRSEGMADYARELVNDFPPAAGDIRTLRATISEFSKLHALPPESLVDDRHGAEISYLGKSQFVHDHLIDAWLKAANEAWGESVVIQEGFRVISLFLDAYIENMQKDPNKPTLSETFFSATYTDPSLMERLIYEGKRSGILGNIEGKMRWLKEDIGPEIFRDESDLAAFRAAIDQMPNFILYVESGMARSGNNLMRTISERDTGYLTHTYVNLITKAYKTGLAAKFMPVWKGFIDFMDVRERRVKKAAAEAQEAMTDAEKIQDKLKEARRQADGVDALKRIGRALFRPKVSDDWGTSMAGEMLIPLRELVSKERRGEMESWLLTIADRTITGKDEDIEAVYNFFSSEKGILDDDASEEQVKDDYQFRKDVADLLKHKKFPDVFVQLDRLFKDEAVVPSIDFLATKIDEGDITRLLDLVRRILGLPGVAK